MVLAVWVDAWRKNLSESESVIREFDSPCIKDGKRKYMIYFEPKLFMDFIEAEFAKLFPIKPLTGPDKS